MKIISVLIVEDDRHFAFTLRKMLTDEGFFISAQVDSGEKAVAAAMEQRPDIILMDIKIHGAMDGVETIARIQKRINIPFVYLTGYADDFLVERAKKTMPFAYLLKPFTKKELTITLKMALYKNEIDGRLKENENRLSAILGNICSGIIATDGCGAVQYMNPAAERFTETGLASAKGNPLEKVLCLARRGEDKKIDSLFSLLTERFAEGLNKTALHLRSPSGKKRTVHVAVSRIAPNLNGEAGVVVVLRDITARVRAEDRLRMMAKALESIDHSILIVEAAFTANGPRIVYANKGFHAITGWSKTEISEKPINLLDSEKNETGLNDILAQCLRFGCGHREERFTRSCKGEDFLSEWNISIVRNPEGFLTHFVFVIRDVSHLRKLEDNIRDSQKIEAVGRLAGGIAHDFNNLLSVINPYSELLAMKLPEGGKCRGFARQIQIPESRGAALVSQLMAFSRKEAPRQTILDLVEITEKIQDMLHRVIRENISLETHFGAGRQCIRGDRGKIEQILINLCVNARDAMEDNGRILMEIDAVRINAGNGPLNSGARPGDYVRLAVEDTGCGMSEEIKERIFDPFFTTKAAGKGTGLGLATVHGIVKQGNGFINVISERNKGTRLEIFLPAVHRRADVEVDSFPRLSPPLSTGTERILLVEDDEQFADCMGGLLRSRGYTVFSAGNGVKALQSHAEQASRIHLLIADVVLPRMSGYNLAARLLKLNPELKVLFITGYDDSVEADIPFPHTILRKPFSLHSILDTVRDLLDSVPRFQSVA